jgi:diaminopimelate decarboxylase
VRPLEHRLLPDGATVAADGSLLIGGVDVLGLVERVGTPVFIYDEAHLRRRCQEARAAFDDGVAYATKAFLCQAMARLALSEGLCLDVSTGGELGVALAAGAPPERLVLHGNNKSEAELRQALSVGVGRIVADSFSELDRLERLVGELGVETPSVLVRVTPGVEAHTHEFVRTGQEDSKFGFGLASGAAALAVESVASSDRLHLSGIHFHIGSQVFEAASLAAAVELVAPLARSADVEELCVGGGLGVAYVEGERAPTISEWAAAVRQAASDAGLPSTMRLSAEPGRSIVAQAAITCYRVGTIKVLPGVRTYVAVDGGMSDNPRPVLYGSGYEAFLPRSVDAERVRPARVVGKHCESGDVLVRDAWLPADVAEGDVLATPVTGAYGYSMASTYNKVPRPAVVFCAEGRARVVVRRERLEDLLSLEDPDAPALRGL